MSEEAEDARSLSISLRGKVSGAWRMNVLEVVHKPLQVQEAPGHWLVLVRGWSRMCLCSALNSHLQAQGRTPISVSQKPEQLCRYTDVQAVSLRFVRLYSKTLSYIKPQNQPPKASSQQRAVQLLSFRFSFRCCCVDIQLLLPPSHLLVQTSHLSSCLPFSLQLSQDCFV